jgi:hypothetical protein
MLMTFSYGDLTNQEFLLRLLRELPLRSESACWMIVTPVPHKAEKADLDSSNDIIAKRIGDHILLTPGSKSDCPINAYLQFIDFYMIFGVALIFGWEPSDSLPVDKEDGEPEYFEIMARANSFLIVDLDGFLMIGMDKKSGDWPDGIEVYVSD